MYFPDRGAYAPYATCMDTPLMTHCDILVSSLVLVGCLAKRKRTINRGVQESLDMEQFHHYLRESFREGLCNHRRTFVCLSVC